MTEDQAQDFHTKPSVSKDENENASLVETESHSIIVLKTPNQVDTPTTKTESDKN